MKEKTIRAFERLEQQRSELLESYKKLSQEQRIFRPGPGSWNLLQVMRHLVTGEKQSLVYIQRKLSRKNEIPNTGFGSAIRFLILKLAMISPLKFKAPKIAEVRDEAPDFDSMISEWDDIRSDLITLIENTDDQNIGKAVYKHPRAGVLNLKQAFDFFSDHITHHQKQIGRIMNHPDFPDSL